MTEILRPDNHDLWHLVQRRIGARRSWEFIAEEVGCDVKPLIAWVLAYKSPPKRPLVRSAQVNEPVAKGSYRIMGQDVQRFENWRRAQAGARAARVGQE